MLGLQFFGLLRIRPKGVRILVTPFLFRSTLSFVVLHLPKHLVFAFSPTKLVLYQVRSEREDFLGLNFPFLRVGPTGSEFP